MKVVFFSHDGALYGAQQSLLTLASELAGRGWCTKLVVPEAGPLLSAAKEAGVAVEVIPYPYPSTRPGRAIRFAFTYSSAARALRNYIDKEAPNALYYNTVACMAPAAALHNSPIPRIWHIRETVTQRRLLEPLIAGWSDLRVFNSRHTASTHTKLSKTRKSVVVYNGMDIAPPSWEERSRVRTKFGWRESDIVAVFAGQLRPHKDPMALVEAIRIVGNRGLTVKGCVIGDGPLMKRLKASIAKNGMEEVIQLTGFRTDALALMAAADIAVCPSLREPFGRSAVEAMALSLPVVAARAGGLPEIVEHGKTGLLINPGGRTELAESIFLLATDPASRKSMGEAGIARYREMFTVEKYVSGIEDALRSLGSL